MGVPRKSRVPERSSGVCFEGSRGGGSGALRGAPEHPGEQRHGFDIHGAGDRNELRDIDAPLEGLDPLDPVGRNFELPSQLPLGEPGVPAGRGDCGGDGPVAGGILHSRAFDYGKGASITVSPGLIRNS